jgi:hypothetical protein
VPWAPPPGIAAHGVGTGHEHPLQMLCGDLGPRRHPPAAAEVSQAGPHEHPRRGSGRGVVAGQRVGALPRPIPGRHRAQQVAVAAAHADPADRDQRRLSWAAPSGWPLVISAVPVRAIQVSSSSAVPFSPARKRGGYGFMLFSSAAIGRRERAGHAPFGPAVRGPASLECRGCVLH